jgi:putative chitinase
MIISRLTNIVPARVLEQMPDVMEQFNIDTPLRVAHFLAQCAHESGNFRLVQENLNYSAQGLVNIFPRHFRTIAEATPFARQPERIANRVYANRIGNGAESSGDGWRFRGRGYIQLTGRANYTAFNRFVPDDVIQTPELVATKYPLLSAAWFWHTRNLNAIADTGSTDAVVTRVTRVVNGGTHGLQDRLNYFRRYFIS